MTISSAHTPQSASFALVLDAARGDRRDYALDRVPIARGGQAEVFAATHKPSGVRVAFKRRTSSRADSVARMKREVEVARALADHPHVMPVLDADAEAGWFVMPLAAATAETMVETLGQVEELRALVEAVAAALGAAHALGWVHRDVKPANILRLGERWVLADWGLGRRPRGQTSHPDRTRVGAAFGTEGFAAPELSSDAHAADGRADLYSLGQLIGWALTRSLPQANVPLLPADGPWRPIVRAATQLDPARRPASVAEFAELLANELEPPPPNPLEIGAGLLREARAGSTDAAQRLLTLAARFPDDYDLHLDVVAELDAQQTFEALIADRARAVEVIKSMGEIDGATQIMPFTAVDVVMSWLLDIAKRSAAAGEAELFEHAADRLLEWDAGWDRWGMQDLIRPWLRSLTGEPASITAGLLRRHPKAAEHFSGLAEDRDTDHRIRRAVTDTTAPEAALAPEPVPPPRRGPHQVGIAPAADIAVEAVLADRGWETMPVLVWQSIPNTAPALLPGLYDEDEGVRGAMIRPGSLRAAAGVPGGGFSLSFLAAQPQVQAGTLMLADSRRVLRVDPTGLVTAAAIATDQMLCWGMERAGSNRRLNVLAVAEMSLEYFRFVHTAVLPRVPGGWQHRILAVGFDSGHPRELGPGPNPQFPPPAPPPQASTDRWDHTWAAETDAEKDAHQFLVWLYALFGLSAKTNPYVNDGRVEENLLRQGFTAW